MLLLCEGESVKELLVAKGIGFGLLYWLGALAATGWIVGFCLGREKSPARNRRQKRPLRKNLRNLRKKFCSLRKLRNA